MKKIKITKKLKKKLIASIVLVALILSITYQGIVKPVKQFAQFKNFDAAIVKVSLISGGHGTGFFTEYKGKTYLITAAHVCGQEPFISSQYAVHIVLRNNPETDTCIAEATSDMKVLSLAKEVYDGLSVYITGFPADENYRKTSGMVLGRKVIGLYLPFNLYGFCPRNSIYLSEDNYCYMLLNTFETDSTVNGGNSGGPVMLDSNGKVVGIVSAMDRSTGHGFFIGVDEIWKNLEELTKNEPNSN